MFWFQWSRMSSRLANGDLGRIIPQELLVSSGTPLGLVSVFVGQNDDAGLACSWELRRNLPGNGQHRRTA